MREVVHETTRVIDRPRVWIPPGLSASGVALLSMLVGFALIFTDHLVIAFVVGICAFAVIGIAGSGSTVERKPPKVLTDRTIRGATAEPPWSAAPDKFVGTITSAAGTRSPFSREECAGWALEVSLAGVGVMLRDGATGGMTLDLGDGRTLTIPAEMLRLARGASSDNLDSVALDDHIEEVAKEIEWDEARAIELRVGDRIEVVATASPTDEAEPSGYRDITGSSLTVVDVPVVRRVTAR